LKASKDAQAIQIKDREAADRALKEMGRLEDQIAQIQAKASEDSRMILGDADARAKPLLKRLDAHEKEMERWAKNEGAEHFEHGSRSLALTFGRLYFHLSPPAIRLIRSVEYVLERLRARKMSATCIRVKEEVNKEALEAYEDEVLKEVGCKRVQKDEFRYDVFRPEVK